MSKVTKAQRESLRNHPRAQEIMEVLESPVDPWETTENRKGHVVQGNGDAPAPGGNHDDGGLYSVHRLDHWEKHGGTGEALAHHNRKQSNLRAYHGLDFLLRPHGKGPYKRATPGIRKAVVEAYRAQVAREKGTGES